MIAMCLGEMCKNEGQDQLYGKKRRVFNPTKKMMGNKRVYRCSICLKEREI